MDPAIAFGLVGLGVGVGLVVGAGAAHIRRRRRDVDDGRRRRIRPSSVGLAEDPIVAALGVSDDEAARVARRRRRPIGTGLHTPPGDSPPPT